MSSPEKLIWQQIQQGDIGIFETFYKDHYKAFILLACKYVQVTYLAEEIVNDVMARIWQERHTIQIESSLKSYCYRSIINRSINELKKQKKEMEGLKFLIDKSSEAYELRQMEINEYKIKIYTSIDRLPDQCRKVFQMSRFEEMKQQEIADALGISIKTVKNHITHALKVLSHSIDKIICLLIGILFFFISH